MLQDRSENYFLSQPHQPFFLAGVVWAIVTILLFMLSYKTVLSPLIAINEFHSYSLIFIVFTQFFVGFLFTTFPRFCQSEVIDKGFYIKLFFILQTGALLFIVGSFLHVSLVYSGSILLFLSNIMIVFTLYRIYATGFLSDNNSDPFWILSGFVFSLISHLAFIIALFSGSETTLHIAIEIGIYQYLIFVAFAVGQRMIPFFSHIMVEKIPHFSATVFTLLLLKSIFSFTPFFYLEILNDFILAAYMLREFLRWKMPLFSSPSILWVLHVSLFWLPVGILIGALSTIASHLGGGDFVAMQIHLVVIGFLTTVLIGFGTRVTLGHSGQPPHADKLATNIFYSVQILVVIRALYSLQSGLELNLSWLFDISASLWIVLFCIWAWRYGPVLYSGKKLT
jgi:uncharacterized protein involved in response to NO